MDAKVLNASIAYVEALKRTMDKGETGGTGAEAAGGTLDFGAMLKDTIANTVDSVKGAESVSIKAVAGQADVTDVVTAVANAEMALEFVVAIRDRVVQAYQDILRMPI